jgi:hypothetical protein
VKKLRAAAKAFALAGMLVVMSGCATVDSVQPGTGTKVEVRGKTYDEVWRASVRAMSNNLTIVDSNKPSGTIRSEARAGIATWGEVVGLFIRPATAGAPTYTVEVSSMKRLVGQFTGQDWSPGVIANVRAELDQ